MERVPNEVLDSIIGQLSRTWTHHDFCQARLVCQRWNQLASRYLFRTVKLRNYKKTADNDFQRWNKLMDLQTVKDNAQRVIIETCLWNLDRDRDTRWNLWEEDGHWPAFVSAIHRIIDLDCLQAIEVHFSIWCRGLEDPNGDYSPITNDREMPSARAFALGVIHDALKRREGRRLGNHDSKIAPIRELRLENLQNSDPPEYRMDTSGEFLLVEKFNFDNILRNSILMPVMDQLVELSLSAHYAWGLLPSRFEGKGLIFPNLKKLSLGGFVIGHFDQLDWVVDQKTLACLRLHACQIVTRFHFKGSNVADWSVNTDDWERYDGEPWVFRYPDPDFYTFSLRWNTVLETIRDGLPQLTEFDATWANNSHPWAGIFFPKYSNDMGGRYTAFDVGSPHTPFTAETETGKKAISNDPENPWNLDDSAYDTDARARYSAPDGIRETKVHGTCLVLGIEVKSHWTRSISILSLNRSYKQYPGLTTVEEISH